MPILDITRPEVLKFLTENYEKVAVSRMKWNNKHSDLIQIAATRNRPEKGYNETDILRYKMTAAMPTVTSDYESGARNRITIVAPVIPVKANLRNTHTIAKKGLDQKPDHKIIRPDEEADLIPLESKMRSVDPKQREILYKCTPEYGRKAYLNSRGEMNPEDKYFTPETTSWNYGWKLKDNYFGRTLVTSYRRESKLRKDMQSRTGPHPDPSYYASPDSLMNPSICYNSA